MIIDKVSEAEDHIILTISGEEEEDKTTVTWTNQKDKRQQNPSTSQ